MNTQTKISLMPNGSVELQAEDPLTGESIRRVFYIRASNGYVRETDAHGAHRQVCRKLKRTGNTLIAADSDDLVKVIRREWISYRLAARRELNR